ncbi:MAG: hypothetical protein ACHQQ3_00815 [Gemmatimonadales bacterium]
MHGSMLRRPLTFITMAGVLAMPAPMSDPVGVYAVIDKVVLAPNASPATIQVWGTFAVTDQKPGDGYQPAAKGYLYYSVNTTNERATRAEWADLQALAGKKTVVGFGAKWQRLSVGRVRCATEAAAEPDVYPLGIGVIKVPEPRNSAFAIQQGLLSASAPGAPCAKGR